jgi:hypothetical protein
MMIIKIKYIFIFLLPATCFGSPYRSHFRLSLAVYNNTVNFTHYLLKKIEFSLKMALIEGAETCSWE